MKMGIQHCGIVRTTKGLGVRIEKTDFSKAFAELRPHDKAPNALEAKMLFRLQPTPLGATSEVIEEITKAHQWETRATKSLGPDAWMIATETAPPVQWLSVNGTVILVKPMEAAKQRPKPIVLAGNAAVVKPSVINMKSEDPWKDVKNDPWAKWNSSRPPSAPSQMPNPAQDTSIAKKLQEQDEKMKHLEQQVGKLTTLYKETTDVQEKYQKENDAKMTQIRDDLKDQMSQVSSSFQSSLDRALSKHDENIGHQFRELKELFMRANPINSPSAPSAKYAKGSTKGQKPNGNENPDGDVAMGASPPRWGVDSFTFGLQHVRYSCVLCYIMSVFIETAIRWTSLSTFSFLLSTRVGEAKNPGPLDCDLNICNGESVIRFSIINPTAIHNKIGDLVELNSNCLCLAETSATQAVQDTSTILAGKNDYRIFWSSPVASRMVLEYDRPIYRGESSGTACMTNLPSRPSNISLPEDIAASSRIMSCVVRLGCIDVLVFSFYGLTGSSLEARKANDYLLASIYHLATQVRMPVLVGGDFNIRPEVLPSYELFSKKGFLDAFTFLKVNMDLHFLLHVMGRRGTILSLLIQCWCLISMIFTWLKVAYLIHIHP